MGTRISESKARVSPVRTKTSRSTKRKHRWLSATLWIIVWIMGLFLGTALGYLTFASKGMFPRVVLNVITGGIAPERVFPNRDTITVLVLGADEDRNNRKQVTNAAARTDSIMVVRVDFANNRVDGLSIPRDTWVRIPGYGMRKINAAHALGGTELTVQTVSDLLGDLEIDYVAVLNYKGFAKMVDIIGGVQINVDKKMDYDDNWGDLHIHLEPGLQWLNGEQAMGFVRYRHGDSDFKRMERQRAFVSAVKDRLKDPRVWLRVANAMDQAMQSVETNLTSDQMFALAYFGRQLEQSNIRIETLPVRDGRGTDLLVNRQEATELLRELRFVN